MASTDFYMNPQQLSVFFVDALKREGHKRLVGWRSAPAGLSRVGGSPGGIDVLTAEGKILRVSTNASGVVEVFDITVEATALPK